MANYNQRNNKNKYTPLPGPATDSLGNLQPQDIEIEKAVLGALLIERDAYSVVCEILVPDSFYDPRHKIIYEAVQRLNFDQKPVDMLTVTSYLRDEQTLMNAGGPAYIAELTSNIVSAAHVEYHARVVAQKYMARQLISYTATIQSKAFDPTQDVDDLMQEAESKLFELSQNNVKTDYEQLDVIIKEAYDLLHKAASRTDGMSGTPSGFHKLDKITAGWQNSDLVILAARPAMGKTAFALSMAKNIAVDQNIPVAFFSLEMSKVQIVNRLISNTCEINATKIRTAQLDPNEWERLDAKIKDLSQKPLYIDDTVALSVFELRTKARRLVREHGVKLIMIDYLQLMNASGMSYGNRQEEVSMISRSLKGLAKELNIPILALSQLNRGVENRTTEAGVDSKRPQLSDLRESGAIEQDADMVCFIHRPEYYRIYEDSNHRSLRGKAYIIIAKHRNGEVGDVLLDFKGEFARFQNEDQIAIPMPGEENDLDATVIGSRLTPTEMPSFADTPFPPADGIGADKFPANTQPF